MMDASPVVEVIRAELPGATIEPASGAIDMPTVYVDREHIVDVLRVLRDHPALQFSFLAELTAVDLLRAEPRFEVVYHLACLGEAFANGPAAPLRRLRVKVSLSRDDARLPTATGIFPSTNWLEREVFDLFGIVFEHHPDLRRLLTPEDWTGHPLRKDYPVQVRKAAQAWSPIQLTAEEFAENVRAQQARAAEAARGTEPTRD